MPRKSRPASPMLDTFLPGVARAADAALEEALREDTILRFAGLDPAAFGRTV